METSNNLKYCKPISYYINFDNYYRQYFSLPKDVVDYVALNSKCGLSRKLFISCKYLRIFQIRHGSIYREELKIVQNSENIVTKFYDNLRGSIRYVRINTELYLNMQNKLRIESKKIKITEKFTFIGPYESKENITKLFNILDTSELKKLSILQSTNLPDKMFMNLLSQSLRTLKLDEKRFLFFALEKIKGLKELSYSGPALTEGDLKKLLIIKKETKLDEFSVKHISATVSPELFIELFETHVSLLGTFFIEKTGDNNEERTEFFERMKSQIKERNGRSQLPYSLKFRFSNWYFKEFVIFYEVRSVQLSSNYIEYIELGDKALMFYIWEHTKRLDNMFFFGSPLTNDDFKKLNSIERHSTLQKCSFSTANVDSSLLFQFVMTHISGTLNVNCKEKGTFAEKVKTEFEHKKADGTLPDNLQFKRRRHQFKLFFRN